MYVVRVFDLLYLFFFFFFNDTATTEIYTSVNTLSLHDALPISGRFLRLPYPFVTEGFGRMEAPNPAQLLKELECQGITVGQNFVCPRLAALTGFVGDLVGVGNVAQASSLARSGRRPAA